MKSISKKFIKFFYSTLSIKKNKFIPSFDLNKVIHTQLDKLGTLEYKLYFQYNDQIISPWHDVPFRNIKNDNYYFINEIPKGSRKKMEINTSIVNLI
jgi:hypothetical protein